MKSLLDDLYFQDEAKVTKKLNDFASAGPAKLHVVADFDLTLTSGTNNGNNMGTWDVIDVLLPPEAVKKHAEIYQSLRPLELAGELTNEIAIEKWSAALDLICSYNLNIDDVEEAFLSVSKLRDGGKRIFDVCSTANIPIVVISAGIRNVIELMAKYYKIEPSNVLSTQLKINENRQIIGWQKDTLVHVLNKKEMGHSELSELRKNRPKILLLGDVPDDASMVLGDADVLRVRVLEPRKNEKYNHQAALSSTFAAGYDLALKHDLTPISKIIDWLS